MTDSRFHLLLERYKQQQLTLAEEEELLVYLKTTPDNEWLTMLDALMISPSLNEHMALSDAGIKDLQVVLSADKTGFSTERNQTRVMHRVHLLKTAWFRYAAAVLLIVVPVSVYLLIGKSPETQPSVANIIRSQQIILPGAKGAILTLADGRQIILDSLNNGQIAQENGTKIRLNNGQVIYDGTNTAAAGFNMMSTPKGRQFMVVLSDGTKVWLNAASSVKYPAAFSGNTRNVTVTGEVYLEVARSAKQPFIVNVDDKITVEVLGTAFNINAYQNESTIQTTLVEGTVRVKTKTASQVLTPGQQSQIKGQGNVELIRAADINKVTAWKNGFFNFENASVEEVMRQLERWYDIDVRYNSVPPEKEFIGKIERNLTLQQVIEVLHQAGLRCKIEGRTLIVN